METTKVFRSGLSPQLIMRAGLARHLKDITKPAAPGDIPNWRTPESQKARGESEIENLTWAAEYAEPGYTAGPRGVLTADWNYFHDKTTDLLEQAGFETEWSDEWTTCDDCGKLVRTQGDCYGWQPAFVLMHECETICLDCIDWPEYLESIEDNARVACMQVCNPEKYGYVLLSGEKEFESGLHPGMNDDPEKILRALQEQGETHLVFRIPETSQFYIRFEVWQRAMTLDRVIERLEEQAKKAYRIWWSMEETNPEWESALRTHECAELALELAESRRAGAGE